MYTGFGIGGVLLLYLCFFLTQSCSYTLANCFLFQNVLKDFAPPDLSYFG